MVNPEQSGYIVGRLLALVLPLAIGFWWSRRLSARRTDARRTWWPIIAGAAVTMVALAQLVR